MKAGIKTIKSFVVIKKILSHLNIKIKIDILRYTKSLQKKLGITINDYRNLSGVYKEGQKDGMVKIYDLDTGNIIFYGEYKNGKKNGTCKEFYSYNDKIKFEGEYLNGKRQNGVMYDHNGNIILAINKNSFGIEYFRDAFAINKIKFMGQYLNGKRWNGIGYDKFGREIYEIKNGNGMAINECNCTYLNGERIGFGEEILDDDKDFGRNIIFKGEYLKDKRNGKGKEYTLYGKLIFEGDYLNDKKMEKGKSMIMKVD